MADFLAFITNPSEAIEEPASLYRLSEPDDIVLCCFFATPQERDYFLNELRLAAGRAQAHPEEARPDPEALTEEFSAAWLQGRTDEALRTLIRWRTAVLGRGYHTYILRQGEPPYPWGVLLAFRQLTAAELRANYERALEAVQNEQRRVMDVFSWGVQEAE